MDPATPPSPRSIRKPYLFVVTNEVTSESTPSIANPASKTIEAGKRSPDHGQVSKPNVASYSLSPESLPANNRKALNDREYEVMICTSRYAVNKWDSR